MFTHAVLGANDVAKAKTFYDAVMSALGYGEGNSMGDRVLYPSPTGTLMVGLPRNGESATIGNGSTLGLIATSEAAVDAAHAAGVANGGTSCEDPPGIRKFGEMEMYLAYIRDPDGNKLCFNFTKS